MIALYRIAVQGWSKEAALDEMIQGGYGFHPVWHNLRRYVMQLDVDSLKAQVAKQGPWR
jgi:protein tyrosine/serine phosphatase